MTFGLPENDDEEKKDWHCDPRSDEQPPQQICLRRRIEGERPSTATLHPNLPAISPNHYKALAVGTAYGTCFCLDVRHDRARNILRQASTICKSFFGGNLLSC